MQAAAAALRRCPHYVWVAICLAGLLLVLYQVTKPTRIPGAVQLGQALLSSLSHTELAAKSVSLPHVLDDEDDAWRDQVEYTVPWPAGLAYSDPAQTRYAVLIPRVGARVRVLLNGHEVHSVGWYRPLTQTVLASVVPQFVHLPSSLLAADASANRLHIQVRSEKLDRSGLSPFYIGDHDRLYSRYRVIEIWQVMGNWTMAVASVFMGLMAVFLWMALKERLFLWIAAASFAHLVRLMHLLMVEPPLPFAWHFFFYSLSFNAYIAFFCLLIEELFGLNSRLVRGLAYYLLLSGPLWLGLAIGLDDYSIVRVWAGGLALCAGLGLSVLFWLGGFGRRLNPDQTLVMVVSLFTLITGVRDFALIQLNMPGDAEVRWMSIGSLVLMFTLGWILLQRATAATREVRRLNANLASTVADREAELQATFQRLQVVERQRAVEDERRRLMRDMHDGVGSQLVQTLNLVRLQRGQVDPTKLETMIHHALEELRMTLDSLEPMEGDLPAVLGTLRRRIGPALDAAGIELEWGVHELPHLPQLDSQGVLHLFRCLQEVFANVVKHARATRITVRTWHDGEAAVLNVTDNGCGLPDLAQARTQGRGLYNLQVRADLMGVQLRFYNAHPGTGVECRFPLRPQP